jgi:hypothetical protein
MPLVGRVLVFDVLTQNRNSYTTARSNEVGLIPKHVFPIKAVDVFSEFTSDTTARNGFDVIDKF